jgi:RNA polymerase sigma-70 factor (ECF subfamily)
MTDLHPYAEEAAALLRLDSDAFGQTLEPYRARLRIHCYRLMGSLQDAEDIVQETFLRAWKRRETYEGRASFSAWLYRIATHACLDSLAKHPRRMIPRTRGAVSTTDQPIGESIYEPIWLEPLPDEWLLPDESNPEAVVVGRERISVAFMAALHLLPPRQRAVLLLREVLEWSASEVAEALDLSVSAVKSLLRRARVNLSTQPPESPQPPLDDSLQARLQAYVQAWEAADIPALLALLTEDATFSMPPIPGWYQGVAEIGRLVGKTIFAGPAAGRWKLIPAQANRQIAFGLYRVDPERGAHSAYGIQVVTFNGVRVSDIITFRTPDLVSRFGLPEHLA